MREIIIILIALVAIRLMNIDANTFCTLFTILVLISIPLMILKRMI